MDSSTLMDPDHSWLYGRRLTARHNYPVRLYTTCQCLVKVVHYGHNTNDFIILTIDFFFPASKDDRPDALLPSPTHRRHLPVPRTGQSSRPGTAELRACTSRPDPHPRPEFLRKTYTQFLQRSRVLSLYRDILRGTRRMSDPGTREETRRFARSEIERNRHVTDLTHIRYLLSTGKSQWEAMSNWIG